MNGVNTVKKVILFVQFIFVMFYLNYGYAQTIKQAETSDYIRNQNYDNFDFIKHTSAEDVTHGDVLTYRYPDLSFSLIRKEIRTDEFVHYLSLVKDKKTFELKLNYFFDFADKEEPPLYFRHNNTRILIHREVDYYSTGFYIFILDEKGRFYQLGRFSFKPIDREEPTFKEIELEVSKRGDELTIYSNKDFSITYKLKP